MSKKNQEHQESQKKLNTKHSSKDLSQSPRDRFSMSFDQELGGTSEIIYGDNVHGNYQNEAEDQEGGYTYMMPPQMMMMPNPQYYPTAPHEMGMYQNPEIMMLRSKILELSRSLANEIESQKQIELRCNEYILQLKKSSQILEEIKDKHREELEESSEKIKELEEIIKEYKNKVYDFELIEEKLRDEVALLKRTTNHDTEENQNLRDKINELQKRLDEAQRNISEKEDTIDRKQQEFLQAKRQLDNLSENQGKLKTTEIKLQNEVRDLELANSKIKLESEKFEFRINDLNDKINDLYRENDKLKSEIQEYLTDLRKKQHECDYTKDDLRECRRQVQDLEKRENVLILDIERKSNEINHLKHLLSNGVQLPQEYYQAMNNRSSQNKIESTSAYSKQEPIYLNQTRMDVGEYDKRRPNKNNPSTYTKRNDSFSPEERYQEKRIPDRNVDKFRAPNQMMSEAHGRNIRTAGSRDEKPNYASRGNKDIDKKLDSPPRRITKSPPKFEAKPGKMEVAMNPQEKQQQIKSVENQLLTLQIEKDKLDKELAKLEGAKRTKANIDRRRDIEVELETLNNTINKAKTKLRSMNALHGYQDYIFFKLFFHFQNT